MEKVLLENGSFEKLHIQENCELDITVSRNANASIYILIEKDIEVNCHVHVLENANLKVLWWNESENCHVNHEMICDANSQVELNLGEMSDGNVHETHKVYLKEEGSSFKLRSATTSSTMKHFDIECIHEAPHTVSQMENYGVIYENGDFKMVDTGRILKGAYGSESHQTSRALILSENQKCEITPVLLIDENDVQASHATTMGQIDENQLYYLQTRGLTKTQALGLITIGYLMPIAQALDNEELVQELSVKIEKKVGLS